MSPILSAAIVLVLAAIGFGLMYRHLRASQNAMDTSRRNLRLALKGTGEAIWVWHLDTQEIGQVGFEPLVEGEFPSRINAIEFIQVFIHPEDASLFHEAIDSHLQGATQSFDVTYRLRHFNLGWIWVNSRGRVVEYDTQGKP